MNIKTRCPACGKRPKFEEYVDGFKLSCVNEKCDKKPALKGYYETRREAIEAWNNQKFVYQERHSVKDLLVTVYGKEIYYENGPRSKRKSYPA